jgi:capsid protein
MEAAALMSLVRGEAPGATWTPPPVPYIDPEKEGLAFQRNIRGGAQTWSESVRERGYDPEEVLAEMVSDNEKFDELGIVLDSDPRKTSQAGLTQARPSGTVYPPTGAPPKTAAETPLGASTQPTATKEPTSDGSDSN